MKTSTLIAAVVPLLFAGATFGIGLLTNRSKQNKSCIPAAPTEDPKARTGSCGFFRK